MTREIKEADAKAKKGLREQRKHFKAAGLKAGEVMEAFTVPEAGGGDSIVDTGIEGDKFDGSGGSDSGSGPELSRNQSWREHRQAPAKQEQQRGTGVGSAASANISAKKKEVEASSPAAVDKLPLKRAWVVSVSDGAARGGESTTAEGGAAAPTPKRSKQGRDDHKTEGGREDGTAAVSEPSGGNVSGGKQKWLADAGEGRGDSCVVQPKCEFGDCSKTATFGVNGTVRYW